MRLLVLSRTATGRSWGRLRDGRRLIEVEAENLDVRAAQAALEGSHRPKGDPGASARSAT
jgi:hypothetical protein